MKTKKYNRFNIAHGGICGLVAALAATAASGGGFSPVLVLLFMSFFLVGNAKYGPGNLKDLSGLKSALVASATWPYLAWNQLDKKFQTPSATTYNAYVNEVFVGTLSDADYSAILRQVLRDPRCYIAQLVNAGWIVVKALDSFVVGVPMLAFWSLLWMAYFDTELYSNVIAILQQGPTAIRELVGKYFTLLVWLWVTTLMLQFVMRGGVPGFQNKFEQETSKLLRQRLKVAAEGEVMLSSQISSFVVQVE